MDLDDGNFKIKILVIKRLVSVLGYLFYRLYFVCCFDGSMDE